MTAPAVAFDQILDVVHLLDEPLGCPRGIPEWPLVDPHVPAWGTQLVVHPCGLPAGHDGPCEKAKPDRRRRTLCGKKAVGTWINWPHGGRACPACETRARVASRKDQGSSHETYRPRG